MSVIKLDDISDSCVVSVLKKYETRALHGFMKYGKTLDRTDLNVLEWLTHLQEELMDATLYIERLKKEVNHE